MPMADGDSSEQISRSDTDWEAEDSIVTDFRELNDGGVTTRNPGNTTTDQGVNKPYVFKYPQYTFGAIAGSLFSGIFVVGCKVMDIPYGEFSPFLLTGFISLWYLTVRKKPVEGIRNDHTR